MSFSTDISAFRVGNPFGAFQKGVRQISLEIEKETKRVLEVAEIEDPSHVPKHTKLIDLEVNERDDRTWDH